MRGTRKLTFFIPNKFNCDWNLAIKTALLREIRLDEFSLLVVNDWKMLVCNSWSPLLLWSAVFSQFCSHSWRIRWPSVFYAHNDFRLCILKPLITVQISNFCIYFNVISYLKKFNEMIIEPNIMQLANCVVLSSIWNHFRSFRLNKYLYRLFSRQFS